MRQDKFPLIYIIEDNPLFLKMIEEHLKQNNLSNFRSFDNADNFVKELYLKPDIVVMDYELGESNGIELLNKIKNRIEQIYIIMLTNSEDIGIALQALQGGAYDYVHKDELSFKLLKYIIDKIVNEHNAGNFQTTNNEMTGFKRFLKT